MKETGKGMGDLEKVALISIKINGKGMPFFGDVGRAHRDPIGALLRDLHKYCR